MAGKRKKKKRRNFIEKRRKRKQSRKLKVKEQKSIYKGAKSCANNKWRIEGGENNIFGGGEEKNIFTHTVY